MSLLTADKKTYKPDLNEMLAVCELNYFLLIKLWPCLINVNLVNANSVNADSVNVGNDKLTKSWGLRLNLDQLTTKTETIDLTLSIIDVARYTTTMTLIITSPKLKFCNGFNLIVRVYHDLRMLEVMEGSGPSALKAIYHSSENNLKPADEKRQINRFLGECFRSVLN